MTNVFPDVEAVMIRLLTKWLNSAGLGDVSVTSWLPDSKELNAAIAAGKAFVQVQKLSGSQLNRVLDASQIEVVAITATRAMSQQLQTFLRSKLSGFYGQVDNENGFPDVVQRVKETKGPVKMPALNPDARRITTNYEVVTRLPRSRGGN